MYARCQLYAGEFGCLGNGVVVCAGVGGRKFDDWIDRDGAAGDDAGPGSNGCAVSLSLLSVSRPASNSAAVAAREMCSFLILLRPHPAVLRPVIPHGVKCKLTRRRACVGVRYGCARILVSKRPMYHLIELAVVSSAWVEFVQRADPIRSWARLSIDQIGLGIDAFV